ncbi:MAG TPA: GGDEF domain-containing protein [Candidatus Eisenbacteria bacterium]|nr:GGDEF domain-containing protein [Candidatus Eisenbacteria bacterium]
MKRFDAIIGAGIGAAMALVCLLVYAVSPATAYFHLFLISVLPAILAAFGAHLAKIREDLENENRRIRARAEVLANQSMTDDITGLYNHRHLLEEIEREIERARRHGRGLCGIMLDVDNFKRINDRYGHLVGDYVLREIAYVINKSIRSVDIVGRYGGDEFVVILPETGYESAGEVAQRIRQAVREHGFFICKDKPVSVTASLGLLLFKDAEHLDAARFLEGVDEAMLCAKTLGKDRICTEALRSAAAPAFEPPARFIV